MVILYYRKGTFYLGRRLNYITSETKVTSNV